MAMKPGSSARSAPDGVARCHRPVSHEAGTGAVDLVAMDGLSIIGTVGFFVHAAALVRLLIGAVVRDRRLRARQAEAERADPEGLGAEVERLTPPRAD